MWRSAPAVRPTATLQYVLAWRTVSQDAVPWHGGFACAASQQSCLIYPMPARDFSLSHPLTETRGLCLLLQLIMEKVQRASGAFYSAHKDHLNQSTRAVSREEPTQPVVCAGLAMLLIV